MITPQLIESKLVEYYLKTTGPYGHAVMRSIDVSEETLTEALIEIENPIETFSNVMRGSDSKTFQKFLSGEIIQWSGSSKFRYIVFLCYVAAQDGGDSENFREKLQEILKLKSPPRLNGINHLFHQLSLYASKYDAYRQVHIPEVNQSHMKLIGIIYEFSFPNWRLKSLLNKNLYRIEHTPSSLSKQLLLHISDFKKHQGLYQAIQIFTKRVNSNNKFLEEDPFWKFYLKWSKPNTKIERKIFFYVGNNLEDSYFDLIDSDLKVSELNNSNSTFFFWKARNKNFKREVFFLKDLGEKYELLENINRLEEVDAVLYNFKKNDNEGIKKEKSIIYNHYCFVEIDYRNIEQVKCLISLDERNDFLPPLQILSSYRRKDLLSLNSVPIKFKANFDGQIEFIHNDFSKLEKVKNNKIICLPHLLDGRLTVILTTNDEYKLSKVYNFNVVNFLKELYLGVNRKEFDLYVMDDIQGDEFEQQVVFKYKLNREPKSTIYEDLLELIYFNSFNGISESDLLKLIHANENFSKFSPYNVLSQLKDYGYMKCGYHKNYKAIKWWANPISLNKIRNGEFLIEGYISQYNHKHLCEKLDFLGFSYQIRQIDFEKNTFPVKVLFSDVGLEKELPEYFNTVSVDDYCQQISFLTKGEKYYKSFEVFKFENKIGRFVYSTADKIDDGIYMLRQKDKKKCNVYEFIFRGKSIISTYCRDQVFDIASQYGCLNIILNECAEIYSQGVNFSHKKVRDFFAKKGVLPYLDQLTGHYYYPKEFINILKYDVENNEKIETIRYNLNRHRKHIRFRG